MLLLMAPGHETTLAPVAKFFTTLAEPLAEERMLEAKRP